MSGFSQMAGALARVGELHSASGRRKAPSRVAQLRAAIIAGPKTSTELELLLGVRNQTLWGCLKRDLDCGRVVRHNDQWHWQGLPAEVEQAILLLRQHGFKVEKFKARKGHTADKELHDF